VGGAGGGGVGALDVFGEIRGTVAVAVVRGIRVGRVPEILLLPGVRQAVVVVVAQQAQANPIDFRGIRERGAGEDKVPIEQVGVARNDLNAQFACVADRHDV